MWNVPNILSAMRIPLAFAFFQPDVQMRMTALLVAMITDGLDGFLARRNKNITPLGTILDPLTDKFFVLVVLGTLLIEGQLRPLEAVSMLSRDFSVILFGGYLFLKGQFGKYRFRSIWCGKVTTTLQFLVLLGLTLKLSFPPIIYLSFLLLGVLALIELYLTKSEKLTISEEQSFTDEPL